MKLYFNGLVLLFQKFILKRNTGDVICSFASKMGVVYIKFAQILAMQNYGNLFKEEDRVKLSKICDNCNPIKFKKIVKIIEKEYGCKIEDKFKVIYEDPIGAASISQVHKAVLKNGQIVAVKVKRKDIAKRINKDIRQIKRIIHCFGRFAKFRNMLGSDNALNLFVDWIKEEMDFIHEKENIYDFYRFAKSVNNSVDKTINICVPRVYNKLCTDNIIVMEFIFSKTINQLSLNEKNKKRIKKAVNDYFKLSFNALFYDKRVVFHGDPHGGNIYLDKYGNIGFLDMGLIFSFDENEAKFIKKLFFNSYNGNYNNIIELLINNSIYTTYDKYNFEEEIKKTVLSFKKIPVTQYFIDMINVFTRYNINPPNTVYKLAKAFVALYGINTFIGNQLETEKLLTEQLTEYFVDRTVNDFKDIVKSGIDIVPGLIRNTLKDGVVKGLSTELVNLDALGKKIQKTVDNCKETLEYFKN